MNRFFVDPVQIQGDRARIVGEDVKHISRVLRLAAGDQIVLCDGACTDYRARIDEVKKEAVLLTILHSGPSVTEPQCRVTLYQGLPKAGKMEIILQKCVELGIWSVVPVVARRSVVKLCPQEFEPKRLRYQRIAYEAAKQARRGIIPQVTSLSTSYEETAVSRHDLLLIADEEERAVSLKEVLRANLNALDIGLIIGPEGGLERCEVATLRERGGICLTMGPRVLRTETAGTAALAMILYELGDME